jgi:hypothetical protein
LFSLFPPVRAALGLTARLPPRELLRLARFALLPVRRLAEEEFQGAGGGLLLGGNALHADIGPEAPGSGFLGFLVVAGGSEKVVGDALVDGDGVGQVEGGRVERDPRPGHLEHQPAVLFVHLALTTSSDSASSGCSDWYWGREGDRICAQRIQAQTGWGISSPRRVRS